MKTIAFCSVIIISSLPVFAQHIKDAAVPDAVKTAFKKAHSSVKASWEKEGKNYEAGFKKDGHTMSALMMPDGTLLETETDITASELPAPVREELKKKFGGKKITEYARIEKASGEVNYEAEINGKDELFNENGKYLRETHE